MLNVLSFRIIETLLVIKSEISEHDAALKTSGQLAWSYVIGANTA